MLVPARSALTSAGQSPEAKAATAAVAEPSTPDAKIPAPTPTTTASPASVPAASPPPKAVPSSDPAEAEIQPLEISVYLQFSASAETLVMERQSLESLPSVESLPSSMTFLATQEDAVEEFLGSAVDAEMATDEVASAEKQS